MGEGGHTSKTCPACGLIAPSSARKCDCGFDFAGGSGLSSTPSFKGMRKGWAGWLSCL